MMVLGRLLAATVLLLFGETVVADTHPTKSKPKPALDSSTVSRAPPRQHKLTVGLFMRPTDARAQKLVSLAQKVSDPDSSSYGKYLTQDELAAATGIKQSEAEAAAAWLRAAISEKTIAHTAVNLSEPHIVAHGDAVTMEVYDFWATYHLGVLLTNASTRSKSLPALPKSVNLLLTPPMQPQLCHKLTEDQCNAHPPCSWIVPKPKAHQNSVKCNRTRAAAEHNVTIIKHNATHKRKPKHVRDAFCDTDFSGWICWREPMAANDWSCFDPVELEGLGHAHKSKHLKPRERRRRGHKHSDVAQGAREPEEDDCEPVVEPLGFDVTPRSESLVLSYEPPKSAQTFKSLEFSYVQAGQNYTRQFLLSDFDNIDSKYYFMQVFGVQNMRPVTNAAVCVSKSASVPPAPDGDAGCVCSESTGRDARLNRHCQLLFGIAPTYTPTNLLMPQAPQTLDSLQKALFIPSGTVADVRATQAVVEFAGEAFLQSDLTLLYQAYGLGPQPAPLVHTVGIVGHTDTPDTAGEGSLDVQVISTLATGAPTTWWGVGNYNMDSFMMAWTVQVNDQKSPPLVHSLSWGDAEALYPPAYVERLDYELMKMTLRGISVMVATGDNGISSIGGCGFLSDLVGSSPWVTAVGATSNSLDASPYCQSMGFQQVLGPCTDPGPVTCSTTTGALITSSGYFSIYRPRPAYQAQVVEMYLNTTQTPAWTGAGYPQSANGLTSPCQHVNTHSKTCPLNAVVQMGRASPDVAAPGQAFPAIVNGSLSVFDGTSAAAPSMAGLVTLLNSELIKQGRPPLGLLNPWLYKLHASTPQAFVDVTMGNAGSCEDEVCDWGWLAAPGWDATTGLGVPRYDVLLANLPGAGPGSNKGRSQAAAVPAQLNIKVKGIELEVGAEGSWGSLQKGGPLHVSFGKERKDGIMAVERHDAAKNSLRGSLKQGQEPRYEDLHEHKHEQQHKDSKGAHKQKTA